MALWIEGSRGSSNSRDTKHRIVSHSDSKRTVKGLTLEQNSLEGVDPHAIRDGRDEIPSRL